MIELELVARNSITLPRCEIRSRFDDQIELASFPESDPIWRLGRLEFPREGVLNLRLENSLRLFRGRVVEGTILASGLRPLSKDHRHGQRLECTLVFYDAFGDEIAKDISLLVDRTSERKRMVRQSGGGLYGKPSYAPPPEDINSITAARYREVKEAEKAEKIAREEAQQSAVLDEPAQRRMP